MSTGSNLAADLRSLLDESVVHEHAGRISVSPRTAQQVASVTHYADANKIPVKITGGGSKTSWSNTFDSAFTLATTNLAGIREHVWEDLTATVAAGTKWSALQKALASHNQRVGLDPLWPDSATVGGIVACNDSGALRTSLGSLRDLILGMTLVLADGTIAKTGGKVVKNVAGYDLHKLMTGAFGTLGVITEVTFRLHPLPKASSNWTISSESVELLERCRHLLAASTLPYEALQMRTSDSGFALDVCLVSLPECMDDLSLRLREIAHPLSVEEAQPEIWAARQRTFLSVRATVKITLYPTGLTQALYRLKMMGGQGVAQQCGIILASVPCDPAPILELRRAVTAQGGSLTILHWPESHASKPDIWGPEGNSFPLMQEIKRRFDPNRTLNPGCFVGGL